MFSRQPLRQILCPGELLLLFYQQLSYEHVQTNLLPHHLCHQTQKPTLTGTYQEELYKYISSLIEEKKCHLYRINGMDKHIHIFSSLHPTITLANYIKAIKLASSDWMKRSGKFPKFTFWQDGYGAFTHSVEE